MSSVPPPQPSAANADTRSLMLYEANKKSVGIAYALWFFLGLFGAHRFYTGQTGSAIAQLVLTIIGFMLTILLVGWLLVLGVVIWVIVDAFLIPGWISNHNNMLAHQLST